MAEEQMADGRTGDGRMTAVRRLVTHVDVGDDGADACRASFSARHEAVLDDGRRLLLLDDRGRASSLGTARTDTPTGTSGPKDHENIWAGTSVEDIEETARVVVGPDEPSGGRSREDTDTAHWERLAEILRGQGVVADARELARLPHDVVLSERLLSCLGPGSPASQP